MISGTKLFIDTEFTDLRQNAALISLGIVADDGKSFYAEFTDFSVEQASDYVRTDILPLLELRNQEEGFVEKQDGNWRMKGTRQMITAELKNFLAQFSQLICWLDYTAYDWVLFCELFGGSFHLPSNLYYIPFDLMTLMVLKGEDPDQDRLAFVAETWEAGEIPQRHHALWDARILRQAWHKLME
ncbi:MAG: 3'-5' exoribonuclease [Bacteroidota bacterium]